MGIDTGHPPPIAHTLYLTHDIYEMHKGRIRKF